MKRSCEICHSELVKHLHTQNFVITGERESFSHDVNACKKCGFVFASDIPSQKQMEVFYKKNIKYAYEADKGLIPKYARELHSASYEFINSFIDENYPNLDKESYKILDVGCGSGHQLYCFKKNGYKNLLGLDPAADCRIIARDLYRVEVVTSTLSEYQSKSKFDLIILASVLEHMNNLGDAISQISALLGQNGLFFISVPDTENFGTILREPFLEFSLEHINYFTRRSLLNLLCTHGFSNLSFNSKPLDLYGGYALNSLWEKNKITFNLKYDSTGKSRVLKYISDSSSRLNQIKKIINRLVKSQEAIVIWGVGSFTSRLFATTSLQKANIRTFVDSNTMLQGKKINGIKIASPETLKNDDVTVFVSTFIHAEAIKKILLEEYYYSGRIISLK